MSCPAKRRTLSSPEWTLTRLLAINALIRVASAGSGQLFAFLVADRVAGETALGALLVGVLGAAFFVTELLGAPYAGWLADKYGQRRVLKAGPVFGIVSATVAAAVAIGAPGLLLPAAVLFLARLNEGASAACAVPTTLTLISRGTRRGRPPQDSAHGRLRDHVSARNDLRILSELDGPISYIVYRFEGAQPQSSTAAARASFPILRAARPALTSQGSTDQ